MNPKETLRAYDRKEASTDDVMRALMTFDNWLAPAVFASEVLATNLLQKLFILGDPSTIPQDELWFFTDETAAHTAQAKGASLGVYANGVPGVRAFAALPAHLRAAKVNIGSDPAEGWFIPQDAFALTGLWASAIALESWLREPESPEKLKALRDFTGYTVLIIPQQDAIATAQGAGGLKNPAMVFTAPDCAAKVLKQAPQLTQNVVSGERLFTLLPSQGVDGVIFNPLGPGPKLAFDLSLCRRVLNGR